MSGYPKILAEASGEFKLSKENFGQLNDAVYDLKRLTFNVDDYGAVGGGGSAAANVTAIQSAITDAIAAQGKLLLPTPPYDFNDTLNFVPPGSDTEYRLDVEARGGIDALQWTGADSKSMLYIKGLKDSFWQGVKLRSTGTAANVVGFDIDSDAAHPSTSCSTFVVCDFYDSSSGAGNIGWRVGNNVAADDHSLLTWVGCRVTGHTGVGSYGWLTRNWNSKGLTWEACAADHTDIMFSNVGFGQSGDFNFYGCLGTANNIDFQLYGSNRFSIRDFRGESGKRFLDTSNASTTENLNIDGVTLAIYAPADEIVFYLNNRPFICEIKNIQAYGRDYTAAFMTLKNQSGGPGRVYVSGSVRCAAGVTPVTLIDDAASGFDLDWHVVRVNNVSQSIGMTQAPDSPTTLAYGATVATNAIRKGPFRITATNGTAYTISTPTNPVYGNTITYDILNSSGGAMGVVTWGAAFKLDATGFVNPANGKRKTISFYYDGTNWVQVGPTSADI